MYALWGVQLTRANGYINFSNCMQAWGFCTSIQLISFFLGNLLKPVKTRRSPGNTWGHLKISFDGIPNSRSILFWQIFLKACCEAKRWKHLSWVSVSYIKAANLDLAVCTKASQTFSGTFSGTLLSLTSLCTKASRNPVEPDLAVHQSLPEICWNVCFAGGTNDYLSKMYKIRFPKMMCFSSTQPPQNTFSKKGIPQKQNVTFPKILEKPNP